MDRATATFVDGIGVVAATSGVLTQLHRVRGATPNREVYGRWNDSI